MCVEQSHIAPGKVDVISQLPGHNYAKDSQI